MCGIAGIIERRARKRDEDVAAMMAVLRHRGLDDNGLWSDGYACFAHARLAIIDVDGGKQPMKRGRAVVSYNGELYNATVLREQLQRHGHELTTTSDTELVVTSYLQWGESFVQHLDGIFAIALWDEEERKLVLARDRLGVKPCFYVVETERIAFASEVKALLASGIVQPIVDEQGRYELATFSPGRTNGITPFRDVKELLPGEMLVWQDGRRRHVRYWQLAATTHRDSIADTAKTIRFLLRAAIERQLVSDVPICSFLSGGLDSSIIVAYASAAERQYGRSLTTYSLQYEGDEDYFTSSHYVPTRDATYIALMSEACQTNHHVVQVADDEVAGALTAAWQARDFPGMGDVDSSLLCFCREVSKSFKVALSGECADELLGGYPWFQQMNDYTHFPWLHQLSERANVWTGPFAQLALNDYMKQQVEALSATMPRTGDETAEQLRERQFTYWHLYGFMQTLLERKDRMSMAHHLEVRVPFADIAFVNYVWNIPLAMKRYNGREKGLLREAMRPVLPKQIIERKKSPFPKTMAPLYERLIEERWQRAMKQGRLREVFDVERLTAMINERQLWFGQLMNGPQLKAYAVQFNEWLCQYNVKWG